MSDYSKLVKALRIRSGNLCPGDICDRCEAIHFLCSDKVMHDAADAIEALQAEVERLQVQLPKRGEWVHGKELSRAYIGNCCVGIVYEDFRCSACSVAIEECEKPKWKYCPNCGAKMEVQE